MNLARQQAILALVAERPVRTQTELARLLARRGHRVDQATLSRDLRALGVAKVAADGGAPRYRVVAEPVPARRAAPLIRAVEPVGNLVVVRTAPGDAPRVGLALDRRHDPAVAGTVAGDDTLLVVVRDGYSAARVARHLTEAS
jgi:transcriptional regulator of arginine metabolism